MKIDGFVVAADSIPRTGRSCAARLKEHLLKYRDLPAAEIMDTLCSDIQKFALDQPQHDDMTIVVLKCETPDVKREKEKREM